VEAGAFAAGRRHHDRAAGPDERLRRAIAYTTEYDLHLYAKRASALAADWGSAAWHRAAVARDLGLPVQQEGPR
jgi:hypothetical protein